VSTPSNRVIRSAGNRATPGASNRPRPAREIDEEAKPLPPRKGAIPPRPGRHRRSSDSGVKARSFPLGATRYRLWQVLRPLTIDDLVIEWLNADDREGTAEESRE
jgi:hypothetical protein